MSQFGCWVAGVAKSAERTPRVVRPAAEKSERLGATVSGWGLGARVGRSYPRGTVRGTVRESLRKAAGWGLAVVLAMSAPSAFAAEAERDPVTLKVVAVNPSSEKRQAVPVKIDLPQEITPTDILDRGDLDLEFDEDRSIYYVYKDNVELAPKETRVFQVSVRDVWFVPQPELDGLKNYTAMLLGRLAKSEYAVTAKQLGDTVIERLSQIQTTQNDDTLSRKARIGAYRQHLQVIAQVKDDLARMEKLLTFVGGPPVPEMLEESPLKSDAPSRTTTWLVIVLIVTFLGLLGGQFFFTWHGRNKSTADAVAVRQAAFGAGARPGLEATPGNGTRTAAGEQNKPRSPRLN
jgi:hypothetical protein